MTVDGLHAITPEKPTTPHMKTHGFCLNEDDSNFVYSFPESDMTREGLERHARFYARGQVRRLIFCANAQRTPFDSKVLPPVWKGCEQQPDGSLLFRGRPVPEDHARAILNAKRLHDKGLDPLAVWLDTARACKREAWLSMRMNDIHDALNRDSFMHDDFWREHPELQVSPYNGNEWLAHQLDFARPEVRQYKLAFVQELLERYDLDGLELDWTRFPMNLRAGFELLDAHCITDFTHDVRGEIRKAAKKRGHDIRLGVRIPGRPEAARRSGLDFLAWKNEKLVDAYTVTNFWPATDSAMPLEIWRELLGPGVELNAGLEIMAQSDRDTEYTWTAAEIAAGFACQYLHQGADHIYLFNYMRGFTGIHDDVAFAKLLDEAGEPETANPLTRRHIVSYPTIINDCDAAGSSLPLKINARRFAPLRLNVGGGTDGRTATALLAFLENEGAIPLETRLNGTLLNEIPIGRRPVLPDVIQNLRRFAIPQDTLHDGDNVIELRTLNDTPMTVKWAEIDII